jgi:hypothetical protein
MKRRALLRKIADEAERQGIVWKFVRQGGRHEVYSLDGKMIPVERHAELDNSYAEMVYRECAEKLGKGWWR